MQNTFRDNRNAMANNPKAVSPIFIWFIFSASLTIVNGKLFALKFIPKRFFNCATMTNKAVDDENADTTGTEMKSTKKPVIKFMIVLAVNSCQ